MYLAYAGKAIAAKIPMIAITIIIHMRFLRYFFLLKHRRTSRFALILLDSPNYD
jgi:hypothetical protein